MAHAEMDAIDPPADAPRVNAPLAAMLAALALSVVVYAYMYGLLARSGPPSIQLRYLCWPGLLAAHFAAVYVTWRWREALRRREWVVVLLGSVLLRAVIVSGPAPNNPDLGRHLWEGLVLIEGHNPYDAPPVDQRYDGLRERLAARGDTLYSGFWLKHAQVRSVYGPLASLLFTVPHMLPGDRVLTLRLMMTLLDLAAILVLMAALRTLRMTPALAVVYAWSPVTLNAFADRGQIDAVMVFMLTLTLLAVFRRRFGWAGVAFAGALLVKISPVLLLLPLLKIGRSRFGLPCALVSLAALVPFAGAGLDGLAGFMAFAERWQSCDAAYSLLVWALSPLAGLADVAATARVLVGLAAVAWAIHQTVRLDPDDPRDIVARMASISAATIILSPVTYPWYTLSLLSFLCFMPRAWMLALTVVPMGWYLDFLEAEPGSVWAGIASICKRWPQPWRLPAYAAVGLLFVRDLVAGRKRC